VPKAPDNAHNRNSEDRYADRLVVGEQRQLPQVACRIVGQFRKNKLHDDHAR